jgi:predicted nucleic acid-binding protein
MLFDTDVLVDLFRGSAAARTALMGDPDPSLSAVSYLELLQGVRSKAEIKVLREDLQALETRIIPLDPEISHRAILLMEAYRPAHGLQLADALIAATALERGLNLVTRNTKHFRPVNGLSLRGLR